MEKRVINEERTFRQRMQTFKVRKTGGGHIAMWERGGLHNESYGRATLIATPKGKKPTALLVNAYDEPNGKHALVQVHKHFFIADGTVEFGTESISLYEVTKIRYRKKELEARLVNEFYHGEWELPLDDCFEKIVEAMHTVLATKDCRSPVFVVVPPERQEATKIKMNTAPL